MTLAVSVPTTTHSTNPQTVPIVVLGTDALMAALPATPVQLAHACLRAGFANVIPASWGDELLAAAVLRRLPQFGNGPAIQCSCPIVAHRLLSVGGDLRHAMLPLVSPPVAIARYVRALSQPTRTRITYVGSCPGANDDAIDIRMRPDALLAMLAERQIMLDEQPRVFESIIPPDRRRFRSQPGGVPSPEALWNELGARTLVELDGEDIVVELAQHLLGGKNILIDAGPRLGCSCSGALPGTLPREARASVVALEPPRASTPVVEEEAPIDLDLPVPAASRTPVEVVAVPPNPSLSRPVVTPPSGAMPLGHRISPVRGLTSVPEARPPRPSGPVGVARPIVGGNVPVARDGEGKSLPRAYVARRRSSPKGIPVVAVPEESGASHRPMREVEALVEPRAPAVELMAAVARPSSVPAESPPISMPREAAPMAAPPRISGSLQLPMSLTPRQLAYVAIAVVMLALSMSAVVGMIVGRLVRPQPAPVVTIQPDR